jgi:uncharacterized protein YceK
MRQLPIILVVCGVLVLPGCKTIDSATSGLANLASAIGGSNYTPEQIQGAQMEAKSALDLAAAAIKKAQEEQLSDYAPERIREALKLFEKANAIYGKASTSNGEYLLEKASLFSSQSNLQELQGYQLDVQRLVSESAVIKDKQLAVLRPVNELYGIIDKFNGQALFTKRYEQTLTAKALLIKEIRAGNEAKQTQILDGLLSDLTALEKNVIEHVYFNELSNQAKVLAKTDLAQQVKVAFTDFTAALSQGIQYSQENVRDYAGIEQLQAKTQHLLERASSLNETVIKLKTAAKEAALENELLVLEQQLFQLSQALGLGDIRHRSIEQQLNEINAALLTK